MALVAISGAAGAASARSISGTAYLSPTHTESGYLYVSGDIKDKVLGRGALVYVVKVRPAADGTFQVTAKKVTLYLPGGTLSGTGSAVQEVKGDVQTVRDGKVSLTKGTGALKGHSFKATFGGELKDGVYTFKYKGSYK